MATLSIPEYFLGGEPWGFHRVGITDNKGTSAIARYTLTMGENESASQMKIKMAGGGYIDWYDYDNSDLIYNILDGSAWLNFYIGTKDETFKNDGTQVTGRVFMHRRSGYISDRDVSFNMVLSASDAGIDTRDYYNLDDCFKAAPYADVILLPNTEYYLWIFPAYTSYGQILWHGTTDTFEFSGEVGFVRIDNGLSFDAYQIYVDNGESWDLYLPYADNGMTFELCSG